MNLIGTIGLLFSINGAASIFIVFPFMDCIVLVYPEFNNRIIFFVSNLLVVWVPFH